ncbi:Golgi-body localization protein [Gracilaria domingensis]|nr:Golgi-body localization protein [Gracilaria domingensis]
MRFAFAATSADQRIHRIAFRLAQWLGGLSISTVIFLFLLFIITIILRRKGYGVLLRFFTIIVYARPGARRFPHGCEVRITTRFIGFLLSGCRGPWLDVSAERFYMRMRPSLRPAPRLSRRWVALFRFFSLGVAAMDKGYWSTLLRNVLTRVLAFLVRGLRIRADKVRIWKDGGSWECKAEQFVLEGGAFGVFGSQYTLSVNELYVNVCKRPVADASPYPAVYAALVLRKGTEINAYLDPRFFTLLRPRRLAILDDLRLSIRARDVSWNAPGIFETNITHIDGELCPGYSRTLRAKLPPSAPATKKPRRPGILRYWEGNGAIHGLSLRVITPLASRSNHEDMAFASVPLSSLSVGGYGTKTHKVAAGPENGFFVRVKSIRVEALGKAADERHEPMTRASLSIQGCSAGSIAVDALSSTLYETQPTSSAIENCEADERRVESVENIEKIVAARPEFLMWVEDVTTAIDVNCSKRHGMRLDFAGHGGVVALEPVGLVQLVNDMRDFALKYIDTPIRRQSSMSSMSADESSSALPSRSSTSSLYGADGEPRSLRMMSDMRHWTVTILGHQPIGAGDTLALVLSSETILLPQIDLFGSSFMRFKGSTTKVRLMHWSQWDQTTNFSCDEAKFDISRGIQVGKKIILKSASIDWDMDAQAGLACLPDLFRELKRLKYIRSSYGLDGSDDDEDIIAMRATKEKTVVSEEELREQRARKRERLLEELQTWELSGSDIAMVAMFPDGPKMGVSIGKLPSCTLDSKTFCGHDVVVTMQDKKFAYGSELRLSSPLHTMHRDLEKRRIDIDMKELSLILYHDVQFGFLLQDWILRLRAAIRVTQEERLMRVGLSSEKLRRRPLPDIYFNASEVQVVFEDHPIGAFITKMLPLMQDESRERLVREEIMATRIQQLHKIARAEIAGTSQRCSEALEKQDSSIWIQRVRKLQEAVPPLILANGHLPPLENTPMAIFVAAHLSFSVYMDDMVREHGSKESIRRLKMLDDYELGSKKYNKTRHYESNAWNSIGFRNVALEAQQVKLKLRNYTYTFAEIDRMRFSNSIVGMAVQATLPPYIAETTVSIGRRRQVKIVKGLGPSKTYADLHLVIDCLQCCYNPSYMGAIVDFGRGVARFFSGGKNPSPRVPWFDTLRFNMHGRLRITSKKLKGYLTSSISPYSMTKHFAEVEADDFEMLTSRLEATERDPYPISWTLHNWRIMPSNFDAQRKSEVMFKYVRVGLNPIISVNSGDPQDHYVVPFPSTSEVAQGGPGIGRGAITEIYSDHPVCPSDNGFGNFTTWTTGLHNIPNYDTFTGFKSRRIILGIHVHVRHPQTESVTIHTGGERTGVFTDSSWAPWGASVVHSDAITTLTKVIKTIVRRPISCRLAPRKGPPSRKPPSETGLSNTLCGLDVTVDAKDLNLMLYNNLEPGHGLFVCIQSLSGELRKRTTLTMLANGELERESRLTRRRFNISNIYCSIRVPGLDLAIDAGNMGKLFTVDNIKLSDDLKDELRHIGTASNSEISGQPSSGFGSNDLEESPFYTFSNTHPLQRGKRLDKVQYDKRLLVERVRLVWSPVRRSSLFAWPAAFEEKAFCMKGPKIRRSEAVQPNTVDAKENKNAGRQAKADPLSDFEKPARTAELLGDSGEAIPALSLKSSPEKQKEGEGKRLYQLREVASTAQVSAEPGRSTDKERSPVSPTQKSSESISVPRYDPLSPPATALSRSKAAAPRNLVGSMIDILYSKRKSQKPEGPKVSTTGLIPESKPQGRSFEVLQTKPKFQLFICDCQVGFGSPETSGIVFLTSKAVRLGLVEKKMQKNMQLGERNETWRDREYRVHLDEANLFTRSRTCGLFDFNQESWVSGDSVDLGKTALITTSPICMDLMYISSSSIGRNSGDERDDHILRPSLLFINIPDISLSTNAEEFHAATDVVRKVLMQSMRSSEIVNEELANLRYKLQLADGKVSSEDLDDFMRRLNNITKQCMYAADTFQHDLVDSLLLPDESQFSDNLLRYKAKAKAVATFMRQDQRASSTDVLYPTMYVSYSFDKCSWELRERHKELNKESEDPFVEITLDNLLFRHTFYVGRGSSTEMTFGHINAKNKMKSSYFQGILEPAATGTRLGPGGSTERQSRIKASDGAPVAFRWYSTQEDRVGGIPVYELLTIQVAPMTAAITRKLYSSVTNFLFSNRSKTESSGTVVRSSPEDYAKGGIRHTNGTSAAYQPPVDGSNGRKSVNPQGSGLFNVNANMDDVSQMAKRGESSVLFKYVFIDAFELTASYKNKETTARGVLDFFDLFVTTPSFSYSSQIWTWKDFSVQLRKDLVMTFAKRGVSNLAKIKLLPGYSRARRKLVQGADSVMGSIASRLPNSTTPPEEQDLGQPKEEDVHGEDPNIDELSSDMDEDEREEAIDAAVADISGEEGIRREEILKALYGSRTRGESRRRLSGHFGPKVIQGSITQGSDSSAESGSVARGSSTGFRAMMRGERGVGNSAQSRSSIDDDGPRRFLHRIRRRPNVSGDMK